MPVQQGKPTRARVSSVQIKTTQKLDVNAKATVNLQSKSEAQTLTLPDKLLIVKDASCADFIALDYAFQDYLNRVKANPNFCGARAPESAIKECSNSADKTSEPACVHVFLQFLTLLTQDQNFERPQNLSDKILKSQIAKVLFSSEGFQKDGAKKIIPLLQEILRRHPDHVGLLRVYTMLRWAPLLLEPLTDYDKNFLDLAISQDSKNISTRNAIVSIYTRQDRGFAVISEMARAYPNDIYPYATLVGRFLLDIDSKSALKWAEMGLAKNPNQQQFLALKQDLDQGTFDINKYYKFNFDISGAFEGIL